MALTYKIYERKSKFKGGAVEQVATQVSKGKVPIREIAERLEKITSLGRGDVMNVLTHLGEVVVEYMKNGYSVGLHELGTFTPRISSSAVPAGEQFKATHIKGVKMRYTPSTYLKAELAQVHFECQTDACKAPAPKPHEEGGKKPDTGGVDDNI